MLPHSLVGSVSSLFQSATVVPSLGRSNVPFTYLIPYQPAGCSTPDHLPRTTSPLHLQFISRFSKLSFHLKTTPCPAHKLPDGRMAQRFTGRPKKQPTYARRIQNPQDFAGSKRTRAKDEKNFRNTRAARSKLNKTEQRRCPANTTLATKGVDAECVPEQRRISSERGPFKEEGPARRYDLNDLLHMISLTLGNAIILQPIIRLRYPCRY